MAVNAIVEKLNGVLILDKPVGESCGVLCRRLGRLLGVNKIGHVGTLDPRASGVLPICLGEATKLSAYLTAADKTYEATIQLGITTDTFDADGTVTSQAAVPALKVEESVPILKQFIGPLLQVPPSYSAKKIDGIAAYRRARSGQPVNLPPQKIFIYDIRLMDWSSPELKIELQCSKGTYVRSLANDLGMVLGCGAHLKELRRTACGAFGLEQSVTCAELESGSLEPLKKLLSANEALGGLPFMKVNQEQKQYLIQGKSLSAPWIKQKVIESLNADMGLEKDSLRKNLKVIDENRQLLALIAVEGRESSADLQLKYLRVFR